MALGQLDEQEEELEGPQPVPTPAALPSLDVPSPPKITRLNPRRMRPPQELVDPVEIARSYLDQACQPETKPFQPYWISSDAACAMIHREAQESAVSLLSVDPLNLHVKSLCQPW